ncbi:MAG: putative porin [Gammaproteobacteria bacterium]|nr:putative porin [Gammaproteobacteria bacterium]NNM11843.1 putative porin [Pseudomonadales bacterium]
MPITKNTQRLQMSRNRIGAGDFTTRRGVSSAAVANAIATGLAATVLTGTALADSYRVELNAGGLVSDQDLRTTVTDFNASATVYLDDVQTVDTIIAESAFLNKSSSVTLGYRDSETEQEAGAIKTKSDGDNIELNARYVQGEKYIFEASFDDGEFDKTDVSGFGLGVGQYIDDLTTIVLNYTQQDIDSESDKRNNYSLTLKSIVDPSETDRAVGTVGVGITQDDIANTIINLNAGLDYYFGPRLSVGGGIGLLFPNNGSDENTYALRSQYFITKRIGVAAQYAHTIFQEEDNSTAVDASDTFELSVTGRF